MKQIQNNTRTLTFGSVSEMRAFVGGTGLQDDEPIYLNDTSLNGWFNWDENSTATDDGIDVVKITAVATGRFLRRKAGNLRDFVSVVDFGAEGDGSTDDRDSINSAIQSLSSTGGTVIIPHSGSGYRVGPSRIDVPSGVSILGFSSVIKAEKAAGGGSVTPVFRWNGQSDGSISGIVFEPYDTEVRYLNGDSDYDTAVGEGQASATAETNWRIGVQISNSSYISVSNCFFKEDHHTGVKVDTATNNNISIHDLQFDKIAALGVFVSNANDVRVSGLISKDSHESRFDHLVYMNENVNGFVLDEIDVDNSNGSVLDFFANGGDSTNISVSNFCIRDSRAGVIVSGLSGGVDGFTCSNFIIDTTEKEAILTTSSDVLSRISFSDFQVYNAQDRAITFIGAAHESVSFKDFLIEDSKNDYSIYVESLQDCTIENGKFIDCFADSGSGVIESATNACDNLVLRNLDFIWHDVTLNTSPIQLSVGTGRIHNLYFETPGAISKYCIENASTGFLVSGCSQKNLLGVIHPSDASKYLQVEGPKEAAIADGDTTPSVLDLKSLITANTGATTISDFDDGVELQEVFVEVNDANTTFDFTGSSLKGNAGVDYVASSGDMVHAILKGTVWHCFISQA